MEYNIYDKESLQITMLCGFLVSSADQDFSDEEEEICFRYMDSHWENKFGSSENFLSQIERQKRKILRTPKELYERMNRLGSYINVHFTKDQKKAFLVFLTEVVNADGLIDPEETELIRIFEKRIHGVNR